MFLVYTNRRSGFRTRAQARPVNVLRHTKGGTHQGSGPGVAAEQSRDRRVERRTKETSVPETRNRKKRRVVYETYIVCGHVNLSYTILTKLKT